ncbi:putative RNA methyltransferase [Paractinoplanes hotanensis]|uniref:Methyltransferase domain-containing protein n=1 Tax=Paractinoplanes hotanensis TaxID=2906497 RepID=A0ABT0XTG8_9ACTN|nr:methyltransferase domain-containing protein [Actinoplanes hotanensis]MCM4077068.1 methyltransferase domain-containing protein [Actinoplanes hotanensis]
MIDGALPYLRCPVCRQPLERAGRTLRCPLRHSFDMAKQGYADLTAGRMPHVGDTAAMIADRDAFLTAGHYDFIADALAAAATPGFVGDAPAGPGFDADAGTEPGFVVDAGTGTGHYLSRVLDALPDATGLGLDVSKPALRRTARAHPRVAAVLTDLWRPLPIADSVADVVLNVFSPRNGPEFHRVLRPDGLLLVVTPEPDHLRELIAAHQMIQVDPDKAARVQESLGDHFKSGTPIPLRREMTLTAAETRTLIGMTPSAHHASAIEAASATVTASVLMTPYRPL